MGGRRRGGWGVRAEPNEARVNSRGRSDLVRKDEKGPSVQRDQAVSFIDPEVYEFTVPVASHQRTITRRSWEGGGWGGKICFSPKGPHKFHTRQVIHSALSLPLPGASPPTAWHGTVDLGDTSWAPAAAQDSQMDVLSAWPLRILTNLPFFTTEQSCCAPRARAGQALSSGWEERCAVEHHRGQNLITRRGSGLSANPRVTHPPDARLDAADATWAHPRAPRTRTARVLSHLLM